MAKSSVSSTKLDQSYVTINLPPHLITEFCGLFASLVMIFLAHNQFTFSVQAPVLLVFALNSILIPVVYAVIAGTKVIT